jgi:hypothetical protein
MVKDQVFVRVMILFVGDVCNAGSTKQISLVPGRNAIGDTSANSVHQPPRSACFFKKTSSDKKYLPLA